jgi:hypothetical protein
MRLSLLVLSFLCAAPARAQLFGAQPDYSNPALYLAPGPQSEVSMPAAALRAEIGVSTSADAEELVPAVYKWLVTGFSSDAAGGALVGKTTADGLLKSRYLSGCHDWALLFSSVARKLGYPALMADTAGIKWAREYNGGESFSGHALAEIYMEGRWMLVDATTGRYVRDYDPRNPVIPLRVGDENAGLYVIFKGVDPQSYGITGNGELVKSMQKLASLLPGLKLKYPAYVVSYSQVPAQEAVRGAPDLAASQLREQDVDGACRQSPCKGHPCKGVVAQAGDWDILVEKADGVYYAHHYPRMYIFEKPETKTLKFSTLKEVNAYLTSLN